VYARVAVTLPELVLLYSDRACLEDPVVPRDDVLAELGPCGTGSSSAKRGELEAAARRSAGSRKFPPRWSAYGTIPPPNADCASVPSPVILHAQRDDQGAGSLDPGVESGWLSPTIATSSFVQGFRIVSAIGISTSLTLSATGGGDGLRRDNS